MRKPMPGKPQFLLVGEPLALDLANTRVCRGEEIADLLDTPAALAAWLRAEGARLAWKGRVVAADLHAVRTLRDALDQLLLALRQQHRPPAAALTELNRALARRNPAPQLAWTAGGPHASTPPVHAQRDTLLQTLAADTLRLLTGPQAARIRECAHPDCRLQFVAHNPRRRWCSGALCGNRARVARHYARQQRAD